VETPAAILELADIRARTSECCILTDTLVMYDLCSEFSVICISDFLHS